MIIRASNPRPIWPRLPDRVAQAATTAFRAFAAERAGQTSRTRRRCMPGRCGRGTTREAVWDLFAVPGEKGARLFVPEPGMSEARFFPDARPNYAEGGFWDEAQRVKASGVGRLAKLAGRTGAA